MEFQPRPPDPGPPHGKVGFEQARLQIRSMEISAVTVKRGAIPDDESDLIEMRYQEALALANLETLFAEGLFSSG